MYNIELLKKTLQLVETHEKDGQWNQKHYRCQSGMCFAGWAVVAAGAEFASNNLYDSDFTRVKITDELRSRFPGLNEWEATGYIPIADFAKIALGLDCTEQSDIFFSENQIEDLRDFVKALETGDRELYLQTVERSENRDEY